MLVNKVFWAMERRIAQVVTVILLDLALGHLQDLLGALKKNTGCDASVRLAQSVVTNLLVQLRID